MKFAELHETEEKVIIGFAKNPDTFPESSECANLRQAWEILMADAKVHPDWQFHCMCFNSSSDYTFDQLLSFNNL